VLLSWIRIRIGKNSRIRIRKRRIQIRNAVNNRCCGSEITFGSRLFQKLRIRPNLSLKLFCQTENIPSEAENILAETENIPSEVQNIPSIPVNSRRSYLKLFLSKEAKAKFSNFNFKLQICNLTGHY